MTLAKTRCRVGERQRKPTPHYHLTPVDLAVKGRLRSRKGEGEEVDPGLLPALLRTTAAMLANPCAQSHLTNAKARTWQASEPIAERT